MTITIHHKLKYQSLELLRQYHLCPSVQVRNQIVQMNYGLVIKEAAHWVNQCPEPYEDLMQIGCLGLIWAIERFDLSKGRAFSTFAMPYIRGEIQHYLRDKGYLIRLPRSWHELRQQAVNNFETLRLQLGRQPTDAEMAERLNLSILEWQDIKLAYRNRSPLSLDIPVRNDEDEVVASLGDLLVDSRYQSFQLAQEDKILIQQALGHLEQRVREVLEFVFLQDLTQRETARRLGISPVTVARRLQEGLHHIYQQAS